MCRIYIYIRSEKNVRKNVAYAEEAPLRAIPPVINWLLCGLISI